LLRERLIAPRVEPPVSTFHAWNFVETILHRPVQPQWAAAYT